MPPNLTTQGDSTDPTGTAEAQGLLLPERDDGQDANGHTGFDIPEARRQFPRRSSILRPEFTNGGPKTPRTANRVRFDIEEEERKSQEAAARTNGNGGGLKHPHSNGKPTAPPSPSIRSPGVREWLEEEDYLSDGSAGSGGRRGSTSSQRLLTDIEAPGVTLAMEGDDDSYEVAGVEVHGRGRPKSNVLSAFMNMANSIIGAGIIGQPYALKQAGLLTGVVLLVLLTVTVDWTIRLIVVNSKLSGANSFQATMEHCFGRKGLIAISVAQWAFAFGGMVAFCVIVGDSIPRVLSAVWPNAGWVADRRLVIVVCVLSVGWPLSLYRDIAKLAKASTLALISMAIIIVAVITQGVRVPAESRGGFKGSLVIQPGIFQAIGVISFAFVCHHNSLLIYGSLRKPTMDRFARVTHFSTTISMFACLAMALAGFLTFGDKTLGNVLNNFPNNNVMVNIARLCFGLNMLTTLPLEAFVCREVMTNYFYPDEEFSMKRHFIISTGLVFSSMFLSLLTCDLGAVFELIGATSACALAYILPPLCYIKLSSRSWRTIPAVACVVFGFVVMGISTVLAIKKMFNGQPGAKCG